MFSVIAKATPNRSLALAPLLRLKKSLSKIWDIWASIGERKWLINEVGSECWEKDAVSNIDFNEIL